MAEMNQAEHTNQPKEPEGWKDIRLVPDMPLSALVDFLNILNQRLVAIEDNTIIDINGTKMSLTAIYKQQAEAEKAEMAKRAANQEKESA